VQEVLAFNETIRIKVNNKDVVLGLRLADQIFVAEDPENNQRQS
jgi:Fe2+ transport system protein FeoA